MKEMSRRSFLKAGAVGAVGLGLGVAFSGVVGRILKPADNPESKPDIDPLAFEDVPLAVQLDLPDGYSPLVTNELLVLGDITGDRRLAEQIAVENNLYPTVSRATKVPPGQIMLLPEGIAPSNVDIRLLTASLGGSLQPRVSKNPELSDVEDFTSREQALYGREIPTIMEFLTRTLPASATRGVVLIRRPDEEILQRYEAAGRSTEPTNGFRHTGFYPSVHPDTLSFRRDIDPGIMKSALGSNGAVLSRIYLTRQPGDALRIKLASQQPFNPLDREWQQYFLQTKKVLAHELAHLDGIDDIEIAPFDPHRIIATVGIGAVLEGLPQRGEWPQGSLRPELWSDPYLQLMRHDRTVYKELLEALGVNKPPFPVTFSESQVEDVFGEIVRQHSELSNMGSIEEILRSIERSNATGYNYRDEDIWQV